ncbi:MAG: transglycosylase SLT domain-containing protein, partial [Treponema sp.]|nr:transglycosylase SLT domain-containing protein [Treponema sp.]
MGGDLLRGKVLMRHSGKTFAVMLGVIIHLAFCVNGIWAETDEARPLRAVKTEDPPPAVYHNPPPAVRPLITAHALEQDLTRRYIVQYSSASGIAWLNAVMKRGSLYLPFIKEEIARRNMPLELAYLPVIESGFQSSARSKSGAVGLWQFMMNSIAPFDIKVNDFVDERRDFQKATRGALSKLNENYRILGDWELALTAYNAGLGAVNKALKNAKTRNYWELCREKKLKPETVQYIPKLVAISYILSQPRRFGLDCWHNSVAWTSIPLGRQVSLDVLASESGADRELLRRLNAELLLGISPADKNYRLKVPLAQLPIISEVLERKDLPLIHYYYYVIRQGDTLSALSKHYGVPLNFIEQHNPGILNRFLKIGETVIIPAFQEKSPP